MRVTRRDFFVTTAVGAAGAAALGDEVEHAPLPVSAEASARWYWIVNKWGIAFTPQEEADIKRLLSDNVKGLEAMRAFPLDNGTEPSR